jgi:adenine specific DNA methylase Mod
MKLLNKYLRGKEWLVNQYNRNRPFEDHISHKIKKCDLADEISFRLLATKDHTDYEWLKEKLKNNG